MLTLPHQLGPYRLEKALGRGGMGVVYEAYHERLRRRVAIKRVRSGMDDPRRQARLQREARTMAQLAHPSIVQVFDLIEQDDSDWIVMERVEGTSLAQRLKSGPLDVDATLHLGVQIAEGLSAAHGIGVIHRDLKTENVMVQPDGRAKILDFGIAKQLDPVDPSSAEHDLSKTGEVLGTSRSVAPEQARGLPVGPRADLFSFGVLLYETLTGTSPFRGETPLDTLTRVLTHTPPSVDELAPGVPEALAELVARLLCKAPEQRPADAVEVAAALRRIQDSRRLHVDGTTEGAETATATVWSTDGLVTDSAVPEPSADEAFWVSPSLGRPVFWIGLSVILAGLVGIFALRSWQDPSPPTGSAAMTAGAAVDVGPAARYEQSMQVLRRIDQPDNVDRALEMFHQLADEDPSSAAAHAGLARAYWEKSRSASGGGDPVFLEQAMAAAHEAVALNGYLADARTSLGLVLYSKGQTLEAQEQLQLALDMEPTQGDALYGLGKIAESERLPDEAEDFYRQAAEREPTPLYWDALGALLYDQGRYEEAEPAFQASLRLAPDNVNALRNLAGLYYAQGRLEESAERLQSALKIRPNASLFSNLGTLYFSRGLYSKAAAAYEDALRMDGASNRYIYWINLGDAYRQIPGKDAEAKRSYRRGTQILDDLIAATPTHVRRLSRRALAQARAGNTEASRADVEVLRRLDPGKDLYSIFRRAVTEELLGEREQALAAIETTLRAGFSLTEVRHEPDLEALRRDPEFHLLLVDLETPAEPQDPTS